MWASLWLVALVWLGQRVTLLRWSHHVGPRNERVWLQQSAALQTLTVLPESDELRVVLSSLRSQHLGIWGRRMEALMLAWTAWGLIAKPKQNKHYIHDEHKAFCPVPRTSWLLKPTSFRATSVLFLGVILSFVELYRLYKDLPMSQMSEPDRTYLNLITQEHQ